MSPQQFFGVVKRRALIVWMVIAAGLGVMFALRGVVPNTFAGVAHVVLVAENGSRDPSVGIVDLPSIATSTVVLQRVRESLNLPISLIDLKANVSANVLGRSSIMAIGFHDKSAERAIDISNAVANELSRYYDEISTQRYDVNVSRLSSEMNAEAAKVRALSARMSKVGAGNPFVVSEKSTESITSEIALLSDQRAAAFAQLAADRAMAGTTLPNANLAKTARHEILSGDPAYLATRSAAGSDAAQLASDRSTYTGAFPGLPGEIAKIAGESAALKRAASNALRDPDSFSAAAANAAADHSKQIALVAGDGARLREIDGRLGTERALLDDIPVTGAQYAQLAAQRAAMQTEYEALATRRANALANRAEASSLGSVVVLDRALKADTQLAGGRTRAAAVAFIFVLALAIGSAFLIESLDPRIRRAEEIEELYGIPVVASFGAKA